MLSGEEGIEVLTQGQINATIVDGFTPDEMFKYDPILKVLQVYAPSAGTLAISLGYRLAKVEYIMPSHVVVFAKIVTKKYLELLISARSSIVISNDVTLDITSLQAKLDLINENLPDDLQAITTPVIMYG